VIPLLLAAVGAGLSTLLLDRSAGGAAPEGKALPEGKGPSPAQVPPVASSPDAARVVVLPKPGKPETAARIRDLAGNFDKVWTDVTKQPAPMPPPAKLIALAQAAAEQSGFGAFLNGNVGSYQCPLKKGQPAQSTAYYDCVEHEDSSPDARGGGNVTYKVPFRQYKDGTTPDGKSRTAKEAGAWDFLTSITVKPFPALPELLAGDLLGYARKQYGQHYYEGFNLSPEGMTAYAPTISKLIAGGVPVRKAGETPETVAGRIAFYAAAMARSLPELTAALGYDSAPVNVPADLLIPWKPSYQARPAPKAIA